jgi:hypothetical protein
MCGEPTAAGESGGGAFPEDVRALDAFFPVSGNEHFQFFSALFEKSLARDAEFSFAPHGTSLEVTIEDKGAQFHDKIGALMDFIGIDDKEREKYRLINEIFPGTVTLLKMDFQKDVEPGLSIYYQTQVSIKMAARISRILGLGDFPGEALFNYGAALGRKGVFVGLDFKSGAPPSLALFYLISPVKAREGIPGLLSCMESLGMSSSQRDILMKYHHPLTRFIESDLFISFLFTGRLHRLLKLDYDRTPLPVALKVLEENGIRETELQRIADVARALKSPVLNYLGMKYGDNSALTFKCYFKRDYARMGSGDMEKVARYLESTIWRFE